MPNIDWKWFIIGILFALFILPFVQAKLGGRGTASRNKVA